MKNFLISLIALLVIPAAANAKSFWLILIKEGRDFSLEKIEMKNWNECKSEGENWKSQGAQYNFHCLKGK